MYESLLFLSWGMTAVQLWIAKKVPESAVAGVLTAPVTMMVVAGAAFLLPPELRTASALVPALKSDWLMMHVSVMMMAYASLMVGSLMNGGNLVLGADPESWTGRIRDAVGGLMPSSWGNAAADAAASAAAARPPSPRAAVAEPRVALQMSELALPAEAAEDGVAVLNSQGSDGPPGGLAELCSDVAYRANGLGFAALTIGLISGAVWANDAWGSYWSWDPKETWALITWLWYAGYLHVRLTPSYSDRTANVVGLSGFFVTWVCYVGVNLFGVGLHSYGFLNG